MLAQLCRHSPETSGAILRYPNEKFNAYPSDRGTITNYSIGGKRRADLTLSISYDSDLKKAKEMISTILKNNPKVLKTPEAEVVVKNLTDSAIQLAVRPWAKNADFGLVSSETLENCLVALEAAGIDIQPSLKEVTKK